MSHIRVKTKYNVEGDWGSIEEKILYADHDNCSDYVTFYDDNGKYIFSVPDTIDKNIINAINLLYNPNKTSQGDLKDDVEYMNEDERKKCKI